LNSYFQFTNEGMSFQHLSILVDNILAILNIESNIHLNSYYQCNNEGMRLQLLIMKGLVYITH
jgi:hypothetical protein